MQQRWLESRAARKLLSNRWALVALLVVLVYGAIAVATAWFGLIDQEQTFLRVGPKQLPGLFRRQRPEKRLADAEYVLTKIENATRRSDPRAALKDIDLGQLHVRFDDLQHLQSRIDGAWNTYDQITAALGDTDSSDALTSGKTESHLAQLESQVAQLFEPLHGRAHVWRRIELLLGTDAQGRSIALRALYSTGVAIKIGSVVALLSVVVGSLLGAAAGFYGGWVDHIVTWMFTTLSSIPSLVLLVLMAYLFTGTSVEGTLVPLYIALSATYWIGPCRVIRGETMKLRELEYIQAAIALGLRRPYIVMRHLLPNVSHLMMVNFSLLFVAAIKGEVILTYLGLGVKNGTSWGIMIEQSRPEVINGFFWQIGTATALMFGLVLAFNLLSDAIQDAFDPRHI